MELVKLTLSDIGPYKGKHVIDFKDISNSLFLITGQTGSGKSFIFDSICFALYGKTSGENRKGIDLKSKYANDTDCAYIELEFKCHNQKYIIKRAPAQIRAKKKGSGSILEAENKELTLPSGDKLTGKVADLKIEEIIGLDFDDFKMTMMIAQGDFYSLINQSSDKRVDIFRKILNTTKLFNFTNKLKDLSDLKKDIKDKALTKVDTYRTTFSFEDELDNRVKNKNELISTVINLIDERLKEDEKKLDELKTLVNELKEKLNEADKNFADARVNNLHLEEYENAKKKLDELQEKKDTYENIKNALLLSDNANDVLDSNQKIIENNKKLIEERDSLNKIQLEEKELKIELDKWHLEEPKIKDYQNQNIQLSTKVKELEDKGILLTEYEKLKRELKNHEDSIEIKQKEIDKLINDKTKYDALIASLNYTIVEIPDMSLLGEYKITLENLNKDYKELDKKEELIKEYLLLSKNHKYLLDEKNKSEASYLNKREVAMEYERKYHLSLAGILASNLEDDMPCPVCGSIHHPKVASLTMHISEEDKKKYNDLKDLAFNELKEKESILEKNALNIESCKKQIKEFIKDEFNQLNVMTLFNNLKEHVQLSINEVTKKKEALDKKVENYNNTLEKIKMNTLAKENLENQMNTLLNEITQIEFKIAAIKGSLDSMKNLEGLTTEIIQNKIKELTLEIEKNSKIASTILGNLSLYDSKIAASKARLDKTNEVISNLVKIEDTLNRELKNKLEKYGFNSLDDAASKVLENYDILKEQLTNYNISLAASKKVVDDSIANHYDKIVYADLSILEEAKNEAELAYNTQNRELVRLEGKLENNENCFKQLKAASSDAIKASKEFEDVDSLYKVASGNTSGASKIEFEVYYQAQVFDEILKVASYKFNQMTDGRYELLPGKASSNRGKSGLEIAVKDIYNNEERPVSSLSGGESFQASMSLALAFSEIIQTRSGGIELNSMFIDEGFGTLDNEMLENTKKMLLELGHKTNRRIGIISHIQELERSIPSQIRVKKTDKGSSFEIINN